MNPSVLTITPEPSASRRSVAGGCCGTRSPKNWRKNGSSMNGYCWGARTRDCEWIVTTAGATRLTTSAYETAGPAVALNGPLAMPLLAVGGSDDEARCNTGESLRLQAPSEKINIDKVNPMPN